MDVVRSRRQASHEIEQSRVGHVPLAGEEQIGAQYGGYRAHTNGFPFPPCRPFFSLFASPITNVLVVRPVLLVCFHRFFLFPDRVHQSRPARQDAGACWTRLSPYFFLPRVVFLLER